MSQETIGKSKFDEYWPKMMTSKVLGIMLLVLLAGCRDSGYLRTEGQQATPPSDFRFVGQSSACFLQLPEQSRSIRVNCFHIDGRLHIHSNRWSKMPRWRGESWVKTVSSNPLVQIEIADKIYAMSATAIDDEEQRTAILRQRGYWYAWDGITVFSFTPIG
ncbi:MAG: hypothetical protein GXP16_03820, partial [Gammaproteobacteria bacterium]|nr:hypothetical protein [Gammaproteobacteria bacterium]